MIWIQSSQHRKLSIWNEYSILFLSTYVMKFVQGGFEAIHK